MDFLALALALLFALFGLACLLLALLGLPGTWVLLAVAAAVELGDRLVLRDPAAVSFGWDLLALCAGLGLVGELIEAGAGAAGAHLGGATRRGMLGALVGGILGAIVLTPLIPIPLLGTLLGALVGTFAGAWLAEATAHERRPRRETARAALAAVLGSLAGRLGKVAFGVVVWVLLVRAALGWGAWP